MKRFILPLSILFFIIMLTGCAEEVTNNHDPVLFEIKKGESVHSVTRRLKEEKIIKNSTRFLILAKLMRKDADFKFGIYQIEKAEKYSGLIDKFSSGATYSIKITIPEGDNIFQVAEILAEKGFISKDEFLQLCKDSELLSEVGLKGDYTLEGYLYPDTYLIPLNYEKKKIVKMFLDHFKSVIQEDILREIKNKGLKLNEVLVMASIIEKEAKQEFEKPIISGVYYNRLKKGMKLQADPTLIYGMIIAGKYDGDIKNGDFIFDSKYNTYKHFGLPPAPIANPGRTSILAAIYPADVEYLYFVAKQDGTHYFSKTLSEHNKAVYEFQKLPAYERRKKKSE